MTLEEKLEEATTGYYAALNAVKFMPLASIPYTYATADKYFNMMMSLEREIKDKENAR